MTWNEWRLPLSRTILSDPAFSSDPRAHPHFPLPFIPTHSSPPPPPPPLPTKTSTPALLQNSLIPRKATMKALVRRLTSRHNLDRIDELDETDPFGSNYHHDGPYEAIGANHVQPTTPHIQIDTVPRRPDIRYSNREFVPRPSPQHQSASWVPLVHAEKGLPFHLEPGQILRHNTIYTSHASGITPVPNHSLPRSNTVATQPDHSRNQSPSNSRTRSLQDSSSHDLHNRLSFPRVPPEHYPGGNTPNLPNFHHDRDATPYVLNRTEITVSPPPRYESRLHNSDPSFRCTPPSLKPTSRKTQPTETAMLALSPHISRHKSVHSLDSSHTITTTTAQSSSGIQTKSLDPFRIRHLPKRLVMPTLLQPQPQPPQPQYKFPPADPAIWQDELPDHHALEGANYEGQPAMYTRGPRLLRKRSSAFPEKMPIPAHVPILQDDAVPIMGTTPSKTVNEAEGTKEKTRRRRLSKRKNDI